MVPFEMNYGANKRLYSDKPPSTGVWEQGDVVINSAPTLARNISQWVCRIGGSSPSWCANGIGRGTTAQRPADLTPSDIGYCYYDSDLREVISWNGFGWEI